MKCEWCKGSRNILSGYMKVMKCPHCNGTGKQPEKICLSCPNKITKVLEIDSPVVSDNESDWSEAMEKLKGINPNYALGFRRGYKAAQSEIEEKLDIAICDLNSIKKATNEYHIMSIVDNAIDQLKGESYGK